MLKHKDVMRDEFNLDKYIVEWLMQNGIIFMDAMTIVSYAKNSGSGIPESYFHIMVANPRRGVNENEQNSNARDGNQHA